MKTAGTDSQEKRLADLAAVAQSFMPKVDLLATKGCFRFRIDDAIKEYKLGSWSDLARKGSQTRETFFARVLEGAETRLKRLSVDGDRLGLRSQRLRSMRERILGDSL